MAKHKSGILTASLTEGELQNLAAPKEPWLTRYQMVCLVVLVIACAIGGTFKQEFDQNIQNVLPEAVPATSTYNRRRSGYSGLYEILQKAGLVVERWGLPYRDLVDKHIRGTLIIVGPKDVPEDIDCLHISKWLSQGNNLIYIDQFPLGSGRRLIASLGVNTHTAKSVRNKLVPVLKSVPQAQFAPSVLVTSSASISGGTPVVKDDNSVIFAEQSHNSGQCLIGTAETFCSNQLLEDSKSRANFQFLSNYLLSWGGPVYFDERCHGYSTSSSLLPFIVSSPVGLIIFQLLVIFCVALVSKNQRFGVPLTVQNNRKISNLEFIDGMASTYRRAQAYDSVWNMLFHSFKARLCKTLSVSPQSSPEEIAQSWADAAGGSPTDYSSFLQKAEGALLNDRLSSNELVALVETCDRLSGDSAGILRVR